MVGEHLFQMDAEHGALLNHAPPRARPVPRPRARPSSPIPRDVPPLLGRDDELGGVRGILGAGAPVEIVGEAGIGKTALLRHIPVRHAGSEAPGDALFLRAAGHSGEDILQFLFEGFYEADSSTVPTVAQLERYLKDRQGLVVLDDADLARRELERVMRLAPRCVFAIGAGDRRWLAGARSIALTGLDERSCLALAERELRRALTERERASLGRLVAALEGHPLRIVQAAHLMAGRRSARSDRAAPSGSPSDQFDEVVARSLEADEVGVLSPLAALPGVALEARRLTELSGLPEASQLLASLEERGLVRAHGGSYSLAGTAIGAIGRRVDPAAWRERALEHYGGIQEEALSPVEGPAILALLDAGAKAGNWAAVIRLARGASAPLALGARWGAWREALDHALVAARELRDQPTEAWALHQVGSRAVCLGDADRGAALLKDALQLRESLGDDGGASATRHNLETLGGGPPTPVAPSPAPPAPPRRQPTPPSAPTPPPARRPRVRPTLPNWPLKPVIATAAAVVLVVLIVLAVTGGGEDSPAPGGGTEKATNSPPRPNAGPGPRPTGAGGGRAPRARAAVIEPKALRFSAPVNRLSKPLFVLAEYKGAASITLGKVRLEGTDRGDFVATDGCNRTTLSRGKSCKVVLSFIPARRRPAVEAGTRTAVLIFSDDGTDGEQTVSLTGSVRERPSASP